MNDQFLNLSDIPHRRFNPLTGQWLLVSPHRTQRPWQGKQERTAQAARPAHDPECYLCPGNKRAGGALTPKYDETYVFTNDFAALLPQTAVGQGDSHPLLRAESEQGTCRVICFSPRHDLTLAEMEPAEIRRVIDLWAAQYAELAASYRWVQIFENKGELMGCSNPHPHGQIWAGSALPEEPAKEDAAQRAWMEKTGRPLLVEYFELEAERNERIIVRNDEWMAVVPYWAVWPFEALLMPRRHVTRLDELTGTERDALADVYKRLLVKYDNLFEISFPYSMGWHGAPGLGAKGEHWQLHAHFYPPLLRSASVRKFLVGYEMLGEAQRDITAESAARRLAELPEAHYKLRD